MTRIALLLAVLAVGPAAAQSAHVRVEADAGEVWVDDVRAGAVGTWIGVAPGTREIMLVGDGRAWDPLRASASVTLSAGDSLAVPLTLPGRLRVETLPIRAVVVRERAGRADTLGTAPLVIETAPGEAITLVASLDGYDTVRQSVEAGAERVTLVLPLPANAVREAALLPTERSTVGRTLLDAGIATATLAAGALAVHYKFRADAIDDRYRTPDSPDFGNEDLRQDVLRLDRTSAIALGAMQVGVGVLALRFVLR